LLDQSGRYGLPLHDRNRWDPLPHEGALNEMVERINNDLRLHSDVSRRGCRTALRQFLAWHLSQTQGGGPLSRTLVQRYRVVLEGETSRRRRSTSTSAPSADAIADVVTTYARPLGWNLAPHDLRRTFAKLARSGQAPLEQIQLALGQQNIQTTQRYLGSELDLADARAIVSASTWRPRSQDSSERPSNWRRQRP
jgi:hypothetical protein